MEAEKEIFSSFERIFAKLGRRAFNVQELEQLRVALTRVVNSIRSIAEKVALGKCKKLNDAVGLGFTKVAADIVKIEERLEAIEMNLKSIEDKFDTDIQSLWDSKTGLPRTSA